jgi:hypothetical protein
MANITNSLCLAALNDIKNQFPELDKEVNETMTVFSFLPGYAKEIIFIHAENKAQKYLSLPEAKQQRISELCTQHNVGSITNQQFIAEVHKILE